VKFIYFQFIGKNISEKIEELRAELLNHDAEAFIVSSLDDIACNYLVKIYFAKK